MVTPLQQIGIPSNPPPGSTPPIGFPIQMDDVGPLASFADGSVWLRSGTQYPANLYVKAAKLSHLKVYGAVNGATITGITTNTPKQIATNGSGTWVMVMGDATNVAVSTNNGATWSAAAHGMTSIPAGVSYGAGVFVLLATGSGVMSTAHSSTGSSWTQNTSVTVTNGGSIGAICFGGGLFVIASSTTSSASTNFIATSPDGTTWTQRTPPSFTANAQQPSIAWSAGPSLFCLAYAGNTSYLTSPDGITWTSRTGNGWQASIALSQSGIAGCAAGILVAGQSSTATMKSVDGINWSVVSLDVGPPQITGGYYAVGANGGVYISSTTASQILFTSDLIHFSPVQLSPVPLSAGYLVIGVAAAGLVAIGTTGPSTTVLYSPNFPQPDQVGTTTPAGGTSSPLVYYRVK